MLVGVITERYGGRNAAYRASADQTEAMRKFWELFYEGGGRGVEAYLLGS